MSKNRRNFTARFKADLVLEVLKGEKELNEIAAENNIQPNLLRNWKKEFEENAAAVFDNRKDGWMEKKLKNKIRKKGKGRVCEKGWPVNDADRLVGKKICRVPWTGLRESIWSKAF